METGSQELLGLLDQEEFAGYHLGESGLMKLPRWIQPRWTQPRWSQWKKRHISVSLQTQPPRGPRRVADPAGNRPDD